MGKWVSAWGQAHTDISKFSPSYKDSTMRLAVPGNVNGGQIRIRLSNREGKKPIRVLQAAVETTGRKAELSFGGQKDMALLPAEEKYSDPATLPVKAGEYITISMAFQGGVISGNNIVECVQCSQKGNYVDTHQFTTVHRSRRACYHDMAQGIPALSSIEVQTDEKAGAIVCFGDSITQQSTWITPLREEIYRNNPGKFTLINKGIGGNRLLSGPLMGIMKMYGRAGLERFVRDVLDEAGVEAVIIAIGTNDFAMARNPKKETWVTAKRLAEGYEELLGLLKSQNIMAIGTTVLPRGGTRGYLPAQEKERQAFNAWLRDSKAFDAMIDLDAITRDAKHPEQMAFVVDSGDHLHPGAAGGRIIAYRVYEQLKGLLWG